MTSHVAMLHQIHPPHTFRPVSLKSTLILASRLGLGLPTGLFPLDFLTKISRTSPLSIWLPEQRFVRQEQTTKHIRRKKMK
jgi:hypothetical protein